METPKPSLLHDLDTGEAAVGAHHRQEPGKHFQAL